MLTGNFERGAQIKLGRLDLDGFFAFGAFGDHSSQRSALPPLALEEVRRRYQLEPEVDRTLIVGDSVLDVRCAREHGIRCIAVTTGFTTRRELMTEGADWVVDNLIEAASCHEVFAGGSDSSL